jgi:hypothetical protein
MSLQFLYSVHNSIPRRLVVHSPPGGHQGRVCSTACPSGSFSVLRNQQITKHRQIACAHTIRGQGCSDSTAHSINACECAVMPSIEHPPVQHVCRTNRDRWRMSIKCMQAYILVQHDAVVPDTIFIAKVECKAVNVPKNAKKEGTSILLVQISLGLSA